MQIISRCSSCGSSFRAEDRLIGKRVKCPKCGHIFVAQDSNGTTYDVFISYAKQDRAVADLVCSQFEKEGLRCWIAPRDILPGAEYTASIATAIRHSRSLVLVFSSSANSSPHVIREVERAVHQRISVVPFRIEDVEPCEALEILISVNQWADALEPPLEPHIRQLAANLRQMLSTPAEGSGVSAQHAAIEHGPVKTSSTDTMRDTVHSKPGVPVLYEQGHRLAYTMGYVGFSLVLFRSPSHRLVSTENAEREYWPLFERICTRLSVKSGLRDHLRRVGRLADQQEINAAAYQHIIAPVSVLTAGDGLCAEFVVLGVYFCALDFYLQCEMQGIENARTACEEAFPQLTLSACRAQLPLDIVNCLRSMQQTHAGSEDRVALHVLHRELVEVFHRPLHMAPPAAGGDSPD